MLPLSDNATIAILALASVLVTYLIVKFKSLNTPKTETPLKTQEVTQETIISDPFDTEAEVEVEKVVEDKKEEPELTLGGSEEGDFGECQEPEEESAPNTHHQILKRDVPTHAKITKEYFKEFSGHRILVAEDNLINQKVLTGLLAGSGIDIVIANDGQEALDILQNDDDFLMVLMDAHMPRVDGFEATRAIRKESKYDHILVVALSGDTAADDIRKMTEAGMGEHLEKPLRMDALYDILYAYSGEESGNVASDYIEVVMTKELNGDQGLEVCGGDEVFYREILTEFITSYENSTQELGELLHREELQKADKLLLDIIGITANIGAESLNAIASDIKHSLSDTKERSYLTLADQYKISLENLIKDIKEYL